MGNFRGKKPLFKWSCSHPWVEMQLQAWSTADDAPPYKVIMNGSLGLFWLSILVRVMISLIRRYHQIEKSQRLQQRHLSQRHAYTQPWQFRFEEELDAVTVPVRRREGRGRGRGLEDGGGGDTDGELPTEGEWLRGDYRLLRPAMALVNLL